MIDIDVDEQISSVRRQLGRRVLEAGEARLSTIRRVYPTTLEDLWEAVTVAERIRRWFLPVEGELQLGGRYQLRGNAGGTVERCDPPRSFAATWEFGGEVSWIEVTLSEEDAERTLLTLEHVAHVDDERWAQFGPGATGVGWELALLGLALHVADPADEGVTEAGAAWAASEQGRRFITRCGQAWKLAAIEGGDAPADAEAAAARTIAFYTGA